MTSKSSRISNHFYVSLQGNVFLAMLTLKFELVAMQKNIVKSPSVKSINNVSGLQNLFEKLDGSVPSSKKLNLNQSSYDIFLIPLTNEKLPSEQMHLITLNYDNKFCDLYGM